MNKWWEDRQLPRVPGSSFRSLVEQYWDLKYLESSSSQAEQTGPHLCQTKAYVQIHHTESCFGKLQLTTVMQFMRLDARYTLKTEDGFFIYVRSKGIYQPNPSMVSPDATPPTMITQDQAEWFTRLQFETSNGPYEWMNYVFAVGVLTMHEGSIIIDAYKLTNFLGKESSSLPARF